MRKNFCNIQVLIVLCDRILQLLPKSSLYILSSNHANQCHIRSKFTFHIYSYLSVFVLVRYVKFIYLMEISHKKVLGKGFRFVSMLRFLMDLISEVFAYKMFSLPRSIIGSEISLISLQLCCWITQSLICIQYNSFIDAFHNVFVSMLGVGIFLWYCIMLGQ
ncbi:hypothetical protein TrispH2_009458, partial [Trichoplax sp. H2]